MATQPISDIHVQAEPQSSWLPMVIIAMAQILMIFNISSLQVSIEGIVSSFRTPATTLGTAIVTYSLVVAGFIMVGARVGQRFGSRRVFRAAILLFGAAMALMTFSPGAATMILAQAIAGAAAAALVPTLVVLVAHNYRGNQQEKALGWLGGAQAMGIVLAFLIAGALSTWVGWRYTFGFLVFLAAAIYKLSGKLSPVKGQPDVDIDKAGVVLAALAVVLISVGANNVTSWGLLLAGPAAPFTVLDMSPAPIMIVSGIFLAQGFFVWSRKRRASGKTSLIALEVLETPQERSAVFSIFIIGALGSAITFLVPLYIQIVQGRSGMQTAVAVIPFSLASFAAAVLVVRLYGRLSPRQLARYAFLVVAGGVGLLGVAIRNDWSTFMVIVSMTMAGLGEGALVSLLFNVLVSASPIGKATSDHKTFSEDEMEAPRLYNAPLEPTYPGFFFLPGTHTMLRIDGSARTDFIYDPRVAVLSDSFIPSAIPIPLVSGPGNFTTSIRGSRISADFRIPVGDRGAARTFFQLDFFGPNGATTPRLRHFYAQLDNILVGQTFTNFMDPDAFPDSLDTQGVNSAISVRVPQFRYSFALGKGASLYVSVETPASNINFSILNTPAVPVTPAPDGTIRFRNEWERGHIQLASVFRYLSVQLPNGKPQESAFGWGVNATGGMSVYGKDNIVLGLAYGHGIARYVGDAGGLGLDVAPRTGTDLSLRALPLFATYGSYQHYWAPAVRSSATFGFVQVQNTEFQLANTYHKSTYSSANLIWNPVGSLDLGAEFLYGWVQVKSGAHANAPRFQITGRYTFVKLHKQEQAP